MVGMLPIAKYYCLIYELFQKTSKIYLKNWLLRSFLPDRHRICALTVQYIFTVHLFIQSFPSLRVFSPQNMKKAPPPANFLVITVAVDTYPLISLSLPPPPTHPHWHWSRHTSIYSEEALNVLPKSHK
jgi:hypothetical protein